MKKTAFFVVPRFLFIALMIFTFSVSQGFAIPNSGYLAFAKTSNVNPNSESNSRSNSSEQYTKPDSKPSVNKPTAKPAPKPSIKKKKPGSKKPDSKPNTKKTKKKPTSKPQSTHKPANTKPGSNSNSNVKKTNAQLPLAITNLQAKPNPYNPQNLTPITITFNAQHVQAGRFDAVVLDSVSHVLAAWRNGLLKEGVNTLTWNPPPGLESGDYKVQVDAPTGSDKKKTYTFNWKVDHPGFQPLVINNLKVDQNPYAISSNRPLNFTFNVQNPQNRHSTISVIDPNGKVIHKWGDLLLQNGTNTVSWDGYKNPQLLLGTYIFRIHAPLISNTKNYDLQFQIKK